MFFPLDQSVVGDVGGFLDQVAATIRAGLKE
jgi:hypothetical protein